jgi:hypothetical protein
MSFTRFKKILSGDLDKKDNIHEEKTETIEISLEESLNLMTKAEIDLFAMETYNVELDRRKTKNSMIQDLLTTIRKE